VVDGKTSGRIWSKGRLQLPIEVGARQISVRIDWCGCVPQVFEVKDGDTIQLECGSNLTGWRKFLAPIYVFFMQNNYLWLRKRVPNHLSDPTSASGTSPAGQEPRHP